MQRNELIKTIKKKGLLDDFKKKFGVNITNAKTYQIEDYFLNIPKEEAKKQVKEEVKEEPKLENQFKNV